MTEAIRADAAYQSPQTTGWSAAGAKRPEAGARAAVTRLTVTAFRNYARARVEAPARPVVLTGPNGAGKTNLLEALSFLAPGRGLRRATLADVARRDSPAAPEAGETPAAWAVAAEIVADGPPIAIGTGLDPEAQPGVLRRVVRIDGVNSGQAALGEQIAMLWLTPQMDRLFIEGAGNRRRFLDRVVYGFHPAHAGEVSAYEHAMRERSRLLREGRGDQRWLAALEDRMATHGVAVAAARAETVERLAAAIAAQEEGPFPKADLALSGQVEEWLATGPAALAEDQLRARLKERRALDAAAGAATEGPHRTDLIVRHRAKGMAASQCSTGEQKALLIGLTLANARLIAAERGRPPILLLDEIAAHLDAIRRRALYEDLLRLEAQAWLTGTDRSLFDEFGDNATRIGVEDARLTVFSVAA